MYPAPVSYVKATSIAHAMQVLSDVPESRPLAGGMSLVPMLKLRLSQPSCVVDIRTLPELIGIREDGGHVSIGAMTTHDAIYESELIARKIPLVRETAWSIGDAQVRNMGTIGGSLAHADPAADWLTTLLALKGQVVSKSPKGERTTAADVFCTGMHATVLEANELVTEVRIPIPGPHSGGVHLKIERRTGDFGVILISTQVEVADNGSLGKVGVGIGGVSSVPFSPRKAEEALVGQRPTTEVLERAASEVSESIKDSYVFSDVKATAEYRRGVLPEMFKRSMKLALARANGKREGGD